MPDVRCDADCRRLIATLRKPLYRGCFTIIYAYGLRIGEAVKELCGEKRHLGGLPGILSVLHTWNGQLGYYGLWRPSKRSLSGRARNLLMLEAPSDASNSATLADILEALGQPPGSSADDVAGEEPSECPRCPRCGSTRTHLLGYCRPRGRP